MEITKQPRDNDETAILDVKKDWILKFDPLLKHVLDQSKDNKISSTDLTELWLFYVEGVRIRKLFNKITQSQFLELLKLKNPIENILSDDCNEITETGVFLYQIAYYLTISRHKLEESLIRYQSIYNNEDPIEWIKNNKGWRLNNISSLTGLYSLWTKLYKVNDFSLDPVLQK
jgi:hypothetical protein